MSCTIESTLGSKVARISSQVIIIIIVNPIRIRESKKMRGTSNSDRLTKEIITCKELHATLDPKIDSIVLDILILDVYLFLQRS
jgi:hypothetical protein